MAKRTYPENQAGLIQFMFDIYQDHSLGRDKHVVLSAAPDVSQIEEGQIMFADVGGSRRLYTKMSGSLRYVILT